MIRITPEMLSDILEKVQDAVEIETKHNRTRKFRSLTIADVRHVLNIAVPYLEKRDAQGRAA